MLNIASWDGVFVIALSRRQLVRSRTPVPCSPRLTWKPWTASLVVASYTPVVASGNHASWNSRLCSSRTCSPLSPGRSTIAGRTAVGDGEGSTGSVVGAAVGVGDPLGVSTGATGEGEGCWVCAGRATRGVSAGPADGDAFAIASPTPYAVAAASSEHAAPVAATRRADMDVLFRSGERGRARRRSS